jgi:hypothetical protein
MIALAAQQAQQFHSDFWVAVATSAPVIALAALVTTGSAFDLMARLDGRRTGRLPPPGLEAASMMNILRLVIAGSNVLFQGRLFEAAMTSLSTLRDDMSRGLAVDYESVSFACLLFALVATQATEMLRARSDRSQSPAVSYRE